MQERVGGWLGGLELSQDWVYMFFFIFVSAKSCFDWCKFAQKDVEMENGHCYKLILSRWCFLLLLSEFLKPDKNESNT